MCYPWLSSVLLLLLQFHRTREAKDEHGCQWSVICCKPSLANCEVLRCDHRDAYSRLRASQSITQYCLPRATICAQ